MLHYSPDFSPNRWQRYDYSFKITKVLAKKLRKGEICDGRGGTAPTAGGAGETGEGDREEGEEWPRKER